MIRGRTELCAAAVAALALTWVRDARAERPSPALVVTRAPGADDCPDAAGIAARMRTMTRDDVLAAAPGEARDTWLQVEFSRTLSGYRGVISARGRRQGTRSIDDVGPGCSSLADAVAVTLVMLLDPEVTRVESVAPPREASPIANGASRRSEPPPVAFGLEASGGAAIGILEHADPFIEAGARMDFGRSFGGALGGAFVFPDRTSVPPGSVELDLWYGYARFSGVVFAQRATRLALFLGPNLGSLGAAAQGFAYAPERRLLWATASFGLELFAALSRSFGWSARLYAVTPFRYEGFHVNDAGHTRSAFRTPGLAGALSLGVAAFP